jgi:hypothetical protein
MGYVTHYEAAYEGDPEFVAEFEEACQRGERFAQYDIEMSEIMAGDVFGGEAVKWYQWEEDMKALSKQFPALLFTLDGEGEESGDIWRAYFRNGKSHVVRAKIVIPEVDVDEVVPPPPDLELKRQQKAKERYDELTEQIAELQQERASLLGLTSKQ